MTDQDYKRAFALLTEKLGRVPTPRDKEWLELTERLRRSYLSAVEQPRREAQNGSESSWRQPREIDAREGTGEALSGPGITQTGEGDRTTGDGGNGPGINYSVAMAVADLESAGLVGKRGPAGGIYAKCGGCGRVWERERRRGRPSARCGECK